MTNLSYELINANVVDNYQISSDPTQSLLNGVVAGVNFKIMLTDFPEIFIHYNAVLTPPTNNTFVEEEELTNAIVLEWAVNTLDENKKNSIYNVLVKKKDGIAPVTRSVSFNA
jgi:hypothetical protein